MTPTFICEGVRNGPTWQRRPRRPIAQSSRHDADLGSPVAPLDPVVEGLAGQIEEHRARLHEPAAEDDDGRIQQVGQVGQSEGQPLGQLHEHVPGSCVPAGGGGRDVLTPDALGVTSGPGHEVGEPPRLGRLAGQATQPAPRREALPASPLTAHADGPVRIDDHVPGLPGGAVGAPGQGPPDDEAAPDAGAEGDDQSIPGTPGRADRPFRHGGAGGVVVDGHR